MKRRALKYLQIVLVWVLTFIEWFHVSLGDQTRIGMSRYGQFFSVFISEIRAIAVTTEKFSTPSVQIFCNNQSALLGEYPTSKTTQHLVNLSGRIFTQLAILKLTISPCSKLPLPPLLLCLTAQDSSLGSLPCTNLETPWSVQQSVTLAPF